jgi:hypothetical protein
MHNHLGTSFMVWNRRPTWFWLVRNQQGNNAAIGTAATEAEAVREARASIEEMTARRQATLPSPGLSDGKALVATLNPPYPCRTAIGWMDWWIDVAHQVTDKMLHRWAELVPRSS